MALAMVALGMMMVDAMIVVAGGVSAMAAMTLTVGSRHGHSPGRRCSSEVGGTAGPAATCVVAITPEVEDDTFAAAGWARPVLDDAVVAWLSERQPLFDRHCSLVDPCFDLDWDPMVDEAFLATVALTRGNVAVPAVPASGLRPCFGRKVPSPFWSPSLPDVPAAAVSGIGPIIFGLFW
jgi:hypothetical protein